MENERSRRHPAAPEGLQRRRRGRQVLRRQRPGDRHALPSRRTPPPSPSYPVQRAIVASHVTTALPVRTHDDHPNQTKMDPADYVYTSDFSHMVVLRDGTDSRAWRVWDVVLEQFRAMGATRTDADAWRLQHDADFHHTWAVELPMWCPDLATYVPVYVVTTSTATSTTPNANTSMEINSRGSIHFHSGMWGVPSGACVNLVERGRARLRELD